MKKTLITSALFIMPLLLNGAELSIDAIQSATSTLVEATVRLDTSGEKVNAVSGEVVIPDGLEVIRIETGSSAILLWIESPRVENGKITYSGITPGSFTGNAELFSFIARSLGKGSVTIAFSEGESFKGDGTGMALPTKLKNASIFVTKSDIVEHSAQDDTAPLPFSIYIGTDSAIFDGARFATFAAQDNETGVAGYKWAYAYVGQPAEDAWATATAPLLIPKSAYFGRIYVKAMDVNRNERLSSVAGPYRYAGLSVGAIILVLALCALYFARSRSSQPSL